MSVLINGFELPKHCGECIFEGFGGVKNELSVCMLTGNNKPELSPERMSDCPLIEIPPHGRLIDENWLREAMIDTLEALKKNPKMDGQEMHLISAFHTVGVMLDDAPTIIEAEGENNDAL